MHNAMLWAALALAAPLALAFSSSGPVGPIIDVSCTGHACLEEYAPLCELVPYEGASVEIWSVINGSTHAADMEDQQNYDMTEMLASLPLLNLPDDIMVFSGLVAQSYNSSCTYATPGCPLGVIQRSQLDIGVSNNFPAEFNALFLRDASTIRCINSEMACDPLQAPPAGQGLLLELRYCRIAQFSYPLPLGGSELFMLTDPVGNLYVQMASAPTLIEDPYVPPSASDFPEGWVLSTMTFTEESEPFFVKSLNADDPAKFCAADASTGSADAPCKTMFVVTVHGNFFQRYFYSGYEPVPGGSVEQPFPLSLAEPLGRSDYCEAACQEA